MALQTRLEVYGPDRVSAYPGPGQSSPIALGSSLLRLLPEDDFDVQPLWSADRATCLVADVRLDNRAELTVELSLAHPETLADSALLLAAWERWGQNCLNHMVGGFAFAIWSPARQEVFAARDHAGERPLFYCSKDGLFALSSMPQALLALPGLAQGFDEERLAQALILAKPDRDRSFFKGIHCIPPGHFLRVTPHRCEAVSYWHPSDARPTRYARDEDYAEALLEIFDRATAARLRSRGQVGSELSSGLDSSSVTASAAVQLLPAGRRLQAYTAVPRPDFNGVAPEGRLANEGPEAADVAALYPNIDHHLLNTAGGELMPLVRRFTDLTGDPVQNSVHFLWIGAILKQAQAAGIDVLLQGALGNATISHGGTDLFSTWLRSGQWVKLARTAAYLRSRGQMSWKGAARISTNGLIPMPLRRLLSSATRDFSLNFSAASPAMIQTHDLYRRALYDFSGNRPDIATERRNFFERFDFGTMNAATRAFAGIDPRDPCGDKRVFDFCYSIPTEQYLVGGVDRSLVRRAMRNRLPEKTLTRTLRGIQSADWYLSVADALPSFRRALPQLKSSAEAAHYLDLPRIEHLLDTWPKDRYELSDIAFSWGDALCRGFAFGYFLSRDWTAATPSAIE